MKTQRFGFFRVARPSIGLMSTLVVLALTVCPARAAVSCHLINAKGVGQDLGAGSTTGNVIGGGLLEGTIAGSITVTGVSGTVASFTETVTFTNRLGTLTVVVTGAIDLNTGQFNASGPVTAGTGKLSGATGNISVSGVANFAAAVFTEDITGAICVDLAP
jgi:hypothetical protein